MARRWIGILLLQVLCIFPLLAGRGDKAGTAGGTALLIPVGAQGLSLSGAPLATIGGLEAAFWNPAGISRLERPSVLFSHMSYLAGISVEYAAVGLHLADLGTVAFSVKSVSYGEIPVTTEEMPDGTGEIARPGTMIAGGSLARAITDHISVGLSAHYLYESMDRVTAGGFAFTGGLQYAGLGGIDALSIGVVVRNLGPQLQFNGEGLTRPGVIDETQRPSSPVKLEATANDLPSTIEIGIGYTMPVGDEGSVRLSSAFQNNNYSDDEYRAAIEYSYRRFITLRAGANHLAASEHALAIFGPTAGLGLRTGIGGMEVFVDYAYRTTDFFDGNHALSLAVGW